MNLKEYSDYVIRFTVLRDRNYELQHAALGIITEAGELVDSIKRFVVYDKPIDVVNVKEEVGDCMWYASLGVRTLDIEFGLPTYGARETPDNDIARVFVLSDTAGAIGDVVMRIVDLGDSEYMASILPRLLSDYVIQLNEIAKSFGFTLEQAADANKAKLDKRYGDKYSNEAALNRDTASEREVLERS